MTQVISTQTNTFKFTDEYQSFDSSYYLTKITVKELKYENGQHYWDIAYVNKFIPKPHSSLELISTFDPHCYQELNSVFEKDSHPFSGSNIENFMDYKGDIILKNTMTSIMVEYLLMDYDQLALLSGATTPQRYKKNIMWSLSYFWD